MIRMMYILPMILGRTFDVKTNTVGVDIYPLKDVQNPRVQDHSWSESNFKTIESSSDVAEVLKIKGDLSLNVKAGMFSVKGFGSYIKESNSKENSVEILTKVGYMTVSKSLPYKAKPIKDWTTLGKEYLGTHYVKTIIYGGDLVASVKFKATKMEYLQDIRATVKASLANGNAFDLVGEGKLEMVDKKLKNKATMEISYFASVPLEGVPNTIKGLRELVKHFEQHVKNTNNGEGVPVEVELEELSALNKKDFAFLKNMDLETDLMIFEDYLDDLLSTKSRFNSWVINLPDTLTSEQKNKISKFSDQLSSVLRTFTKVIANLDIEKGTSQLDEAKEAYSGGKRLGMAGKFHKQMNKLMAAVVPPPEDRDKGASVYIHPGSRECLKDNSTAILYEGYLTSSPRNSTGSGFNYVCMPKNPTASFTDLYAPKKEVTLIAGVKYGLMETNPHDKEDDSVLRGVVCAVCIVEDRQTLVTFHGHECPETGGWTKQYSGFLMSSTNTFRSESICVDSSIQSHQDSYMSQKDQSIEYVLFKNDDGFTFFPCVLCSK